MEQANAIIEEGSSVRSIYENGVSIADHTSRGSKIIGRTGLSSIAQSEQKSVRHISRGRNTGNPKYSMQIGTPSKYSTSTGKKNLPQLNTTRNGTSFDSQP